MSTYGSLEIIEARSQGDDKKITWIIDNNNNKFEQCALVKTCTYFDGKEDILIEKYLDGLSNLVYTTDPYYENYLVPKSKY